MMAGVRKKCKQIGPNGRAGYKPIPILSTGKSRRVGTEVSAFPGPQNRDLGHHFCGELNFATSRLHAVLRVLVGVKYTVGRAAMGPDEEQEVLAIRGSVHPVDEAVGIFDRMPVDFEDDVAGSKAGIVGRASGANALDRRTFYLRRPVPLRAKVGREICHGETQFAVLLLAARVVRSFLSSFLEFTDGDFQGFGLAVTENPKIDGVPRRHLAYGNLESAAVDDLLAVEITEHVAALQSGTACGGGRRYLADDGARRGGEGKKA